MYIRIFYLECFQINEVLQFCSDEFVETRHCLVCTISSNYAAR